MSPSIDYARGLYAAGRRDEALVEFSKLEQRVEYRGEAAFFGGMIYSSRGDHESAAAAFRRSLASSSEVPAVWNNLGSTLRMIGDLPGAIAAFRRALQIDPSIAEARSNLGGALQDAGEFAEGLQLLESAVAAAPNFPEARGSLALALLLHGRYREGWKHYEERGQLRVRLQKPTLPLPIWDGRPLNGQSIFLQCEQGFGDSIQFIRYAAMVADRGGRVIVGGPQELKRLLATAPGVSAVVTPGDTLPPCVAQRMLMSLAGVFDTVLETVPAAARYLTAPAAEIEYWARQLQNLAPSIESRKRVGLVWAGGIHTKHDKRRSISLEHLTGLGQIPNLWFVSLQKGPTREQIGAAAIPLFDPAMELADFADTAALIANLDLVVTVDTAVAHLAGAMGKPVWMLIPYSPDWRWMLGRNDSPWYPSMRLFRQPAPGDWVGAISELQRELHAFART